MSPLHHKLRVVLWNTGHRWFTPYFCMLFKLVFRMKLSETKCGLSSRKQKSQTKSWWNNSMWSYLKSLNGNVSLEQLITKMPEWIPWKLTLIRLSRVVKHSQRSLDRRMKWSVIVTLEAVQSDIALLKEAMASQNASEREKVHHRYPFENRRRHVCQACQRAN